MDALRKPFFVAAAVLMLVAVLVDVGSAAFLKPETAKDEAAKSDAGAVDGAKDLDSNELEKFQADCGKNGGSTPPGLGIPSQVLVDFLVLYAVAWMGASLIVPEKVTGRLQGLVTVFVALAVVLGSLAAVFAVLGILMGMVALLLAAPFGTIAYLVLYGHFPTGAAAAVLAVLMVCKLGFAACLVLAHQRFLQNRSLVLLVLTSLLTGVLIGFLHGFVPGPLVSIADAIAALVCGVLALIWGILLLVTSIVAVVKAVV